MMNSMLINQRSPIEDMDWSFRSYMNRRLAENAKHISGDDVPDYAYGLDYELRRKLDAIPGLHSLASKMYVTLASTALQDLNRNAIAVTPSQFPDVYDIACDCARRLGMAVPNVYISNNPTINACAYCSDDIQPVIEVHSGLYERVTPGELKAVIGHECGHVQNNHVVYDQIATLIANIGLNGVGMSYPALAAILSQSTILALSAWSRAAEVTSDRAGMICADDPEDSFRVNAKFMYGATFKEQEIDFDALEEQLKMQLGNISKFNEILDTHPSSVRRIMAEREFAECSLYYDWRPDLKKPDMVLRSKHECDDRCKAYINLTSNKKMG